MPGKEGSMDMDIEDHLIKISYLADNLVVLSKGVADLYPESEGAILIIDESIKREVDETMDLIFPQK